MSIVINGNKNLKFIKAVYYQPVMPPPANVGDIAYWDGSSVKTTPLSSWNTSLGTPVGVVMIPGNFLPDGKARIISLNDSKYSVWDENHVINIDSPVPNFSKVPATDNAGSTSTGGTNSGNLPSDRSSWTGKQSYVDPLTRYYKFTDSFIPSPYLSDGSFNTAYSAVLEGGNALSDFNGLSNTQLLVNESEQYLAAYACWNYRDASNGADGLQWYLPAIGELGFLMSRFELINQSIQAVGGIPVVAGLDPFWSSSENYNEGDYDSYCLYTREGSVYGAQKGNPFLVREVSVV